MVSASKSEAAGDDLEAAVDSAIAACDGDPRAAIKALVVANHFLHEQVERLTDLVSPGFARGSSRLSICPDRPDRRKHDCWNGAEVDSWSRHSGWNYDRMHARRKTSSGLHVLLEPNEFPKCWKRA